MQSGYIQPMNTKVTTQKNLFGQVLRIGRYYDVTYQRGKSTITITDAKYTGLNDYDELVFALANNTTRNVRQSALIKVKLSTLSKPSLQDRRDIVTAARERRQQKYPEKQTPEYRDSALELLRAKAAEREHVRQRVEGWTEDGTTLDDGL